MDHHDQAPLENTITRIAGLSTHAEAERAMHDVTPAEHLGNTATGRELADIIDELGAQHDQLATPAASVAAATELDRATPPRATPSDPISAMMQEMEARLRREIDQAVTLRTAEIESDYRGKLLRMRELANEEMQRKEVRLREELAQSYSEKEQLLRSYYKKLIGLANKISKQKAQLQEAKKQFEVKLISANQLYREVEEMRQLLTDHIGYLEEQAADEVPPLAISL